MAKKSKLSRRGCLYACVILAGIVLVLLAVAQTGIRHYFRSQLLGSITPEEQAQLQSFMDEPVELPDKWFTPLERSEDIQRTLQELNALYDQNVQELFMPMLDSWLSTEAEYTEQQWQEFDAAYPAIQPLVEKLDELGRTEGYDLAAWAAEEASDPYGTYGSMGDRMPGSPGGLLYLQVYAKIVNARARSLARQGRWSEAFAHNLAVCRLAQRSPLTTTIAHLIGGALMEMSSRVTIPLAQECDDEIVLQETLDELLRIRASVCLDILGESPAIDALGTLRAAKFLGEDVDFSPGREGVKYVEQAVLWKAEKAKQARQASLQAMAQAGTPQPMMPAGVPLPQSSFRMQIAEFVKYLLLSSGANADSQCYIAVQNAPFVKVREKTSICRFDIACLFLAQALAKNTGVADISGTQDLMPAFLKEEPHDPFAAGPSDFSYLFDTQRKVFYSVGPDRKDDRNAVEYNSSNGIVSSGDISALFDRKPPASQTGYGSSSPSDGKSFDPLSRGGPAAEMPPSEEN